MPIFQEDEDRRYYLEFLSRAAPRFRVGISAWGFMTNPVPLIAVPEDERALARAMRGKHTSGTAEWLNFAEALRGYLFQGGKEIYGVLRKQAAHW